MALSRRRNPGDHDQLFVRAVQRKTSQICECLNFESLLPHLLNPDLRFLSGVELRRLSGIQTSRSQANELMLILDGKGPSGMRKFVACLLVEKDHLGHNDVANTLMKKFSSTARSKIHRLVNKVQPRSSPHSCGSSAIVQAPHETVPRLCVKLIEFQGALKRKSFMRLDRRLWLYFSNGMYTDLETLIQRVQSNPKSDGDFKIIAMWFASLIAMHRDHDYQKAIDSHLTPALEACQNSRNGTILEGRVYQRMAQNYLTMSQKDKAKELFERAETCLQFVGRGYDKVNMFCRRAKLLAATEPERRDEIEDLYKVALQNVTDDDPFALASQPSLILSKAAFHLKIPFGSCPDNDTPPPDVSEDDITKAKHTLQMLPEEKTKLLVTRKCERALLSAELLRLEDEEESACDMLKVVIQDCQQAKLKNLVAIAENRLSAIKLVDELLEGLPKSPEHRL